MIFFYPEIPHNGHIYNKLCGLDMCRSGLRSNQLVYIIPDIEPQESITFISSHSRIIHKGELDDGSFVQRQSRHSTELTSMADLSKCFKVS